MFKSKDYRQDLIISEPRLMTAISGRFRGGIAIRISILTYWVLTNLLKYLSLSQYIDLVMTNC